MPDPITTPYSLELTKDESLKDVVVGTSAAIVLTKMKIFLGANVNPGKRQSIVGSLKACYRVAMNQARKGSAAPIVASGDALGATNGNITLESDVSSVGDGDVAVIISDTFDNNTTHFTDETFRQLVAAFQQNSAGT